MNWLVTVRRDADLDEVRTHLNRAGCHDVDIADASPVDDDIAIAVTGPDDLPRRLSTDPLIAGVWNNTDLMLM